MHLLLVTSWLLYLLVRMPGSKGRKKLAAVVFRVEPDKETAERNAANPTKFVATGDAFVNSSVVQTQRSCVQDNVLIQNGGNAAGMLPVNSSVQITRGVVAMGLVVTLDRRAARKMVCGLVFQQVIKTAIFNALHVFPTNTAV
jgi:hypothetical protein